MPSCRSQEEGAKVCPLSSQWDDSDLQQIALCLLVDGQ